MTTPPAAARKSSINRRKSLQLSHRAVVAVPIPPSLLQSPYLDPQSIFQRTLSAPRYPTDEDEKWLQDTVPVEHSKKVARLSTSSASSSSSTSTSESSTQLRPQSVGPISIPTSPPLVRWQHPRHNLPSKWHEPFRVRSVSSLVGQEPSIRPPHIPTPSWQRPRLILPSTWAEPHRVRSAPPRLEEQREFFTRRP